MTKRMKNWIRGAGSLLEILPSRRARWARIDPFESDSEALWHDWQHIDADIQSAIDKEAMAIDRQRQAQRRGAARARTHGKATSQQAKQ